MAYSKTQVACFLAAAATVAAVAMVGFGVPLGTLLIIGLLLCCPVMMLGMHGGADTTKVSRPRPKYQMPQEF